jgi:hypothetical protein
MTHAINIPIHFGCNPTREETQWPAFDQNQEYCGHTHRIAAWAVSPGVHAELGVSDYTDLYLTSEGHWATTLEIAEHLLVNKPTPKSFTCKGATLNLFVPAQWAEENGNPNPNGYYRVFKTASGYWDADEKEDIPLLVGASNEF